MNSTITINGVQIPEVAKFSEDEVFLDVWVMAKGGLARRQYSPVAVRTFHLEWVGLTATEIAYLKNIVSYAMIQAMHFKHPSELKSGQPATFAVVVNPRSPGFEIQLQQGYVRLDASTLGGPVLYDAALNLITQPYTGVDVNTPNY